MGMIPTEEAAKIPGFPAVATLRRWAQAGEITAEQTLKGSRRVWLVDPESIRAKLAGANSSSADYEALVERWEAEQASGYHRGRAMGAMSIRNNTYGLNKFWEYLRYVPKKDRPKDYKIPVGTIPEINPENLRKALSTVPVDYKAKNCHFTLREHMWKGVCSFVELLIRQGLKTQADLAEMKKLKPRRVFPPRKTVLTEQKLEHLLSKNLGHKAGRKDVDIQMTQTVMMLAAMAGLRQAEIRELRLEHVRLEEKELDVIDGKGHKDRTVGLVPQLCKQLKVWKTIRPKTSDPHFIVTKNGTPLDSRGLNRRVERIAKETGVKITPHGLRRTFATVNIKRGMPLPIAQMLLGHGEVTTTMEYVRIDEKTAVDFLKGHAPKGRKPS